MMLCRNFSYIFGLQNSHLLLCLLLTVRLKPLNRAVDIKVCCC